MQTQGGHTVNILSTYNNDLYEILLKNRNLKNEELSSFFDPQITDLHDPYLMPDMENAVTRVLLAREQKERIVIFGDYDVDGVSSTAILVKFLTEIWCIVSYRLPHRVHDGYGLKEYFFDELKEKDVKLVITVDCGTRDIGPIKHAKTLGIDVIVTDHHAVPDNIPEEVIAIVNPKRKDSIYPYHGLAGAGVAFKLLHGILIGMKIELSQHSDSDRCNNQNQLASETFSSDVIRLREMQISSDSRSDPVSMQQVVWILHSQHSVGSWPENDEQTSFSENSNTSMRLANEPQKPIFKKL